MKSWIKGMLVSGILALIIIGADLVLILNMPSYDQAEQWPFFRFFGSLLFLSFVLLGAIIGWIYAKFKKK